MSAQPEPFEAPVAAPFGLSAWLQANQEAFSGPVSNKVVWRDSDHIFMIIRGPNARSDFHIDPYDEIFLQLEGSVRVDLMTENGREQHWIHKGELMLVPAGVPHSPLRPEGTWGLVIERPRPDDMLDELVWFCEVCNEEIHRVQFHVSDIETQLAKALGEYNSDPALRTCPNGHLNPVPQPFAEVPPEQ